jgi:hypothetical protein
LLRSPPELISDNERSIEVADVLQDVTDFQKAPTEAESGSSQRTVEVLASLALQVPSEGGRLHIGPTSRGHSAS